ncbi:unnamed protein product [Diamesa serratosioi]
MTLDLTKKCEEVDSKGLCMGVNFAGRNMNTSLDGGKDDKSKKRNSKSSNSSKVSSTPTPAPKGTSSKLPVSNVSSTCSEEPILGSTEADFACSPVCMAEKLAKHCIRYEVTKAGKLIGVATQFLTECFASAIKCEAFSCEQVTMLLKLTKDCDDDVGTFSVCVCIKKDDCKTTEK